MQTPSSPAFRIHPKTLPDHISLTVSDLDREVAFYRQVIGLQEHWHEGRTAGLGAGGPDLVRLVEDRSARRYPRATGLYHFAILLPDRRELARAIGRLFALRYPNAPTDHIMTKTTYLDDPEANNIELYCESPEDGIFEMAGDDFVARRADGTLSSGLEPLDVEALLTHLQPDDRLDTPMPAETRIGHFHLHVADLDESMAFYHGDLGFDDMGIGRRFGMGMASAGRYHHHIGFNLWRGAGAPPPPEDALGLRYIAFKLPDQAAFEALREQIQARGVETETTEVGLQVRDPSRNALVFSA